MTKHIFIAGVAKSGKSTFAEKICENKYFSNYRRSDIHYFLFYCSERILYIHKFLLLFDISNILWVQERFFDKGMVTEYKLNLSSGAMTYKLQGDQNEYIYTVPNVALFVDDVHADVMEYNTLAQKLISDYNVLDGLRRKITVHDRETGEKLKQFQVKMVSMFQGSLEGTK